MFNLKRFQRTAGTFIFILVFGHINSAIFWTLYLLGYIRINGYRKLFRAVTSGRLIIAANHPTLLEGFLIPAMLGPWMLFDPKRYFVWSVPDEALFPKWLRWLYEVSHSIKVNRNSGSNNSAIVEIISTLESGATVVIHPEGGRTDSVARKNQVSNKRFGKLGNRKIRRLANTQVTDLALKAGARIIPIWIDVPFRKKDNGFKKALWIWITQFHRITIYVGEPYIVNPEQDNHQRNKELAQRILSA
ncbi:MAG: 1-acyl-sn-glycerol-3-phosphate acyltransferase [Candidatus Paceibacteria bacterium]|jgi:1-acyl-sn-glycerol-3-phosphate acyltransferase